MLVRQVDPETGEEVIVDDGQGGAPQALQPADDVQGPVRPEGQRISFGAPTQQLDAVRAEDAKPLAVPQLTGMPPTRPVADLASASQEGKGPGFVERLGGPKPETLQGRGFWDTLGQYATSDMGRNLIGALNVGLQGIRNPRDGGAGQAAAMQTHMQGVAQRADRARTGEANTGLYTALQKAQALIADGDIAGASAVLTPLAKNPAVMQNPVAMNHLLQMQGQLTRHMQGQASVKKLSEGPEPKNFREFMTMATAAGMSMDDIIKMAPSMVRDTKPQVIHSDKLGIWEYHPDGTVKQLVTPPAAGLGTPVKMSDFNDEAKKGFNWLMANHPGVTPQDFLAELNHPTKERRDAAAAALGMGMKQVANADAVKKAGEKKDAEMLQLEKERQVRQEKATEAADKDTKLTWSEKPAEGALWFDKKTRQPVMSISPEEPMRAGMKSGKYVRFASATAAEMLPAFESAFSTLDKLYTIAKRNPSAIAWGSSGKFSGPASMMSKDVAEVQALMGLGLSNLVRTQGEKGNLSEGDVQRAMNALGGLSSGGGYERKLQTVLDSLNSSLKVKGFEPFKFSYKEPEKGAPPERRLPGGLKF